MRYSDLIESLQLIKSPSISPEINELINASTKDPFLGDIAKHKKVSDLVVFMYDKVPAGFAIPRKESGGYYRTGPIFVLPEYRGKGIAKQFVNQFFHNKKGRAYISDANTASQAVFTNAGFVKTAKSLEDEGELLFLYVKN